MIGDLPVKVGEEIKQDVVAFTGKDPEREVD